MGEWLRALQSWETPLNRVFFLIFGTWSGPDQPRYITIETKTIDSVGFQDFFRTLVNLVDTHMFSLAYCFESKILVAYQE